MSAIDHALGPTLEDQLHRARAQLVLAADLFDLQAVVPEGTSDRLSAAACGALREIYRQASQELRATLDVRPARVLHHTLVRLEHGRAPRPRPTGSEEDALAVDDDGGQ